MDMDTIKSCPFCGSNRIEVREDQGMVYYGGAYYIECQECKSRGKVTEIIENAVIAWNLYPDA